MSQVKQFQKDLEREAAITRKMLSRVPDGKYDWKPHPKSMSIRQLTTHIAELPSWFDLTLNANGLDFATMDYKPTIVDDTKTLLEVFEKNLADGREQLANAKEETLDEMWTMRNGDKVYSTEPKGDVIRMTFSQMIHHRAQLGVFLRLLDVPIPGSYGPSADEPFS
ncbi:MAG TPA: DinB family protein [Chitinophagaceae bacterium]|nr:DinB family protein [Chitinophagaceae bacterium]